MKKICNKFLSAYIRFRYPAIPRHLSYYIRDNFYARWRQWRYFFRDYMIRKPYKTVLFQGEFSQELMFALPFAYWHYKNGTLLKTVAPGLTNEFYFFSPDHEERFSERNWKENYNYEIPNICHNVSYDFSKWLRVPLKEQYTNSVFRYDKPLLVIANRYNIEWDRPPISYFSVDELFFMIDLLKDKYQVIYNRPGSDKIVGDNSEIKDLNEKDRIREKYPEVLMMDDLFEQHKSTAGHFNRLQLMVYSNCENFISIHGGTAVLASYFGGTNLIFSKEGVEHYFDEFQNLYPHLSGARILHVRENKALYDTVKANF